MRRKKAATDFHKNISRKDGLAVWCKKCKMSGQRLLRNKRIADGKCSHCGKQNLTAYNYCGKCRDYKYRLRHIAQAIAHHRESLKTPEYLAWKRKYSKTPAQLAWVRQHYKNKSQTDIQYILAKRLRTRLYCALKGNFKAGSAVRDLRCSIAEFKEHLESQFAEGMSWNNYGKDGWSMDHIIPLHSVNLTDREQFLRVCHFSNLRPLWQTENVRRYQREIKEEK